jgi:DNA-binding transcriptional MocR family regulator
VDALYLMPTFHNPLGTVMPTQRREAIAAIARRYDLLIIEDDAYCFLEVEVRPAIRSIAPERTLQVFSLSKQVSLALRLGALVVPKSIAPRTTTYMRDSGISGHPLATATAARIARNGELQTLANAKRLEGAARFAMAKLLLGDRAISLHPHGWHILLATPNDVPGTQFVEHARTHAEVAVSPGAAYRLDGRDDPIVRVSFGGERDRDVLADGLKRLAGLFP